MKKYWFLSIFILSIFWIILDSANTHLPQRHVNQRESHPSPLPHHSATKLIQDMSLSSGAIILTNHAKKRMRMRNLSFAHIAKALRSGEVWDEPGLSDQGNWLYKMNYEPPDGSRRIEVVVAIEADRLIVITAMRQGDD
jgi:hypothetical protein